ncbi:thioredoxin family protein [Capnocytophaga stomatis]|uniref:Thiol reductase thioredoxin n=1 Tax=Capnocytophaga stomatis TaxID=1848904 RepID=A0A250FV37_9FLAO|nr:thioredoxin family protein [Capnocytophaga stomatis]ATA88953.1 thiol reductase thioredoxin [Capnocytophaga stomatis]GIJ94531.1 thiol reductase thioredoxin [Capnocytophaga stomatis]GIJ95762.1 thiol reductase thioredoxin [Capnocytophaga stomatis]GIM48858.1 thiol reductase thioredoxin [Capnocytophaga stomatis]
MEKFGDVIDVNTPVLICFFADWHEPSMHMNAVLREILSIMGNRVKVVKIDVDKNKELTKALKVNGLPTLVIYNKRELVWREEGFQDSDVISLELSKYIN